MHNQCLFWDIWCACSRWNCWRHFLDVPGVHSGLLLVYYCTLWYLWLKFYISTHFTFHDMSFFVFSVLLGRLGCIRSSNISFEINYKGSIWGLTKWSSKWSQYVLILSTFFIFSHNGRDLCRTLRHLISICRFNKIVIIIWKQHNTLNPIWSNSH
jgi:hypothetical protein